MFKMLVLLGALAVSTTAHAAPTMWDKVEVGMSREQVQALYPLDGTKNIEHHLKSTEIHNAVTVGVCHPQTEIFHSKGTVTMVIVDYSPLGLKQIMNGACSDEAYQAMLSKYGQPQDADSSSTQSFGGTGTKKVNTWLLEGVSVTMERFKDRFGNEHWSIYYTPRTQSNL